MGGFLGGGMLISLLSAAVFNLVVGIVLLGTWLFASGWSGNWLVGKVFGKGPDRTIEQFKADYLGAKIAKIADQLQSAEFQKQIDTQITATFTTLKQNIQEEVDELLDNTQRTLSDLHARRDRDEALTTTEIQELNATHVATRQIQGNAQRLSSELVQIMSV